MDINKIFSNDFWNKLIAILIIAIIVIFARLTSLDLPNLKVLGNNFAIEEATKKIYLETGKSTNLRLEYKDLQTTAAKPNLWKERGAELTKELKAQRRYIDKEGNSRTFIYGYDSYHWMRLARNVIETGTHCDGGTSDPCRNEHSLAPVGHNQYFMTLPHIHAIAWAHKLTTLFDADFPLPASAFYLSLFLAALIIIPSFFIGNILTGFWGGVGTAILVSFGPIVINRTLGIDTDIWNVLLLLSMLWLTMESFLRTKLTSQVFWIALAGFVTGLWALIWSGWMLGYLIILSGLLLQIFLSVIQKYDRKIILQDVIILITYYLACGLAINLGTADIDYFQIPHEIYQQFFSFTIPEIKTVEGLNWPDHLQTVGEWRKVGATGLYVAHGGKVLFFLSLIGGLLILLTKNKNYNDDALIINKNILGIGFLIYSIIFIWTPDTKIMTYALFSSPLLFALFYRIFLTSIPDRRSITIPGIIIITLLACLWLAYDAIRLLLFSWLPVAILLAATLSLGMKWLSQWINNRYENQTTLLYIPILLFYGFITYATTPGFKVTQTVVPPLNSALQKTFEDLSNKTDKNTIISGLWEYGYWAQYYSDRRTSTDGGTLRNRANYWLNRAFSRENERETIGLLRMLNCSSDASYYKDENSAIELIKSTGRSEAEAFRMVKRLTKNDRIEAEIFLNKYIDSKESVDQILNATHCTPPESILITSTEMISISPSWFGAGVMDLFDPESIIGHPLQYQTDTKWLSCNVNDSNKFDLSCEVNLAKFDQEKQHYIFNIDFSDPESFYLQSMENDAISKKPKLLIIAGENKIKIYENFNPDFVDIGILFDKKINKILVGRPDVLKSTYTQLHLLEGRYSEFFEPISHHVEPHGETVYAWRVKRWE